MKCDRIAKYVESRMWFCRNGGNYNYWDLSEEQPVAWWHFNDMNELSDRTHSTSFVARWYRPTTLKFNLIYYTNILKTLRKIRKLHPIDHRSIWSNNHTKTGSGLPTMSFLFPFTPFYKIFFISEWSRVRNNYWILSIRYEYRWSGSLSVQVIGSAVTFQRSIFPKSNFMDFKHTFLLRLVLKFNYLFR